MPAECDSIKPKLAIVATHLIQYQAPIFREITNIGIDCVVYYASNQGLANKQDKEFGKSISWDIDLTRGYEYHILGDEPVRRLTDIANLRSLFKKDKITHILLFAGWDTLLFWRTLLTAKMMKIPLIYRGDTIEADYKKGNLSDFFRLPLKRIIKWPILWLVFRQIDHFLAVGANHKKYLLEHAVNENKIILSRHSIDNDYFMQKSIKFMKRQDYYRKKLGIGGASRVFLFCGKLIKRKRPEDVIQAFKLVYGKNDYLLIVGAGPLEKVCKIQASTCANIKFFGFINQSALPMYYAVADALILPSENETWGLVVNEAFASGLTAIVSDGCACHPDLIEPDVTGLLYHRGDIEGLKLCLSRLIDDEKLLNRMKRAVKKKIIPFSIRRVAGDVKELLQQSNFLPEK